MQSFTKKAPVQNVRKKVQIHAIPTVKHFVMPSSSDTSESTWKVKSQSMNNAYKTGGAKNVENRKLGVDIPKEQKKAEELEKHAEENRKRNAIEKLLEEKKNAKDKKKSVEKDRHSVFLHKGGLKVGKIIIY